MFQVDPPRPPTRHPVPQKFRLFPILENGVREHSLTRTFTRSSSARSVACQCKYSALRPGPPAENQPRSSSSRPVPLPCSSSAIEAIKRSAFAALLSRCCSADKVSLPGRRNPPATSAPPLACRDRGNDQRRMVVCDANQGGGAVPAEFAVGCGAHPRHALNHAPQREQLPCAGRIEVSPATRLRHEQQPRSAPQITPHTRSLPCNKKNFPIIYFTPQSQYVVCRSTRLRVESTIYVKIYVFEVDCTGSGMPLCLVHASCI